MSHRTRRAVLVGMSDRAPPRFATFTQNGWSLIDAERAYLRRDGVYWIPPAAVRQALAPGTLARLIFVWVDPAPDDPIREGLWVEVQRRQDGAYLGRLVVEPLADAPVSEEAELWFRPEHVTDVGAAGERPYSAGAGLLRCPDHGWSEPALVCGHLALGEAGGFHEQATGALRPGARCDRCAGVRRAAEPTTAAEPVADTGASAGNGLHPICAGCYDRLRATLLASGGC